MLRRSSDRETLTDMAKRAREHLHHCAKSIGCVTGVVLIWHGIGGLLEYVQIQWFSDYDIPVSIGAIALGIAILYLPDRDLDELQ